MTSSSRLSVLGSVSFGWLHAHGGLEFQHHLDCGQPEANCLQIQRTLEAVGVSARRVQVY